MESSILVKLKMKKSYKRALYIIGFLLIAILVIGAIYIFYDKVVDGEDIEVDGMVSINYVNGKKINIENEKTYKFSVSNNDDKVIYYNINFLQLRGTGTYTLLYNDKVVTEGILNTTDEISTSDISVDSNDTKIYTLIVKNEGSENLKGKLNIRVQNSKVVTFADTILSNNTISDPLTNVGEDIATEDEGLIKDIDDIGVTYYFRGNIENNYVSFANLLWRIVRINGDGTVRLVLNTATETPATYYNETLEDNSYLNSNINTYLKEWLANNIDSSYVSNAIYCNDMSYADDSYLNYNRIVVNKIPTFTCLSGTIHSNIGLLSIDELVLAGASPDKENTSFYLYNKDITDTWYTMSGAKNSNNNIYLFMFDNKGKIRTDVVGNLYRNVRPVINIIKNVEATGDGTINNPYIINKL